MLLISITVFKFSQVIYSGVLFFCCPSYLFQFGPKKFSTFHYIAIGKGDYQIKKQYDIYITESDPLHLSIKRMAKFLLQQLHWHVDNEPHQRCHRCTSVSCQDLSPSFYG
jgi:hypothetical protein